MKGRVPRPGADPRSSPEAVAGTKTRSGSVQEFIRLCMISKPYKCFTVALASFIPVHGICVVLPHVMALGARRGVSTSLLAPFLYTVALWLSVQFLYNFAMVAFSEPGYCRGIRPTASEATGRFSLLPHGDEASVGRLSQVKYAASWCESCSHWKPPRTHHCRQCNRCTLKMEQHFYLAGNCVGLKNAGNFVLMFLFAVAGLVVSALVVGLGFLARAEAITKRLEYVVRKSSLHHKLGPSSNFEQFLSNCWKQSETVLELLWQLLATMPEVLEQDIGITLVFHLVATVLALILSLSIGVPAIIGVLGGTTGMEESYPFKEFIELTSEVFCPLGPGFYRQGYIKNLQDVLGRRILLRLVLPTNLGAPAATAEDIHRLAVMPRPSSEGLRIIRKRLHEIDEKGPIASMQAKTLKELGISRDLFAV
eukprot:TRINITY_DN30598_c0_g1_i1.p1 TRINITY_DN30598_c0_g1~~TRINITY_DN30598_c0_g1_i1.p1  ORF type:complete len:423 (-),score=84.49 TRINITY_DN30598_c0_g1_i1:225-1493(-)